MPFDTLAQDPELYVKGTLAGVEEMWVMSNLTEELNSHTHLLFTILLRLTK